MCSQGALDVGSIGECRGGGRKIPAAVTGGLVCLGLRLVWEPLGAASRGTPGHEAVISWADVFF